MNHTALWNNIAIKKYCQSISIIKATLDKLNQYRNCLTNDRPYTIYGEKFRGQESIRSIDL